LKNEAPCFLFACRAAQQKLTQGKKFDFLNFLGKESQSEVKFL